MFFNLIIETTNKSLIEKINFFLTVKNDYLFF